MHQLQWDGIDLIEGRPYFCCHGMGMPWGQWNPWVFQNDLFWMVLAVHQDHGCGPKGRLSQVGNSLKIASLGAVSLMVDCC